VFWKALNNKLSECGTEVALTSFNILSRIFLYVKVKIKVKVKVKVKINSNVKFILERP